MFVVLAKTNKRTRVLIQSFLPLTIPHSLNNLRKRFTSLTVPYTSFPTKAARTRTQAGQKPEAGADAETRRDEGVPCPHGLPSQLSYRTQGHQLRGRHTHNGQALPH